MDDLRVGVKEREGGSPVAIAGLSDAAGIDQVTGFRFQLQRNRFCLPDGAVFGTETVGSGFVRKKSALQMRVPEKSQGHGRSDQRRERITQRHYVFIFIVGGTMDQLHLRKILQWLRAVRQGAEPCEIVRRELVASPDGGGGSHGIEIIKGDQARCSFVVVAANENLPQVAGTLGNFVGTGAIADDVAEICHQVERRSSSQAGLQRFEVGMYVAKQQYAQ